MPHKIAYIVSRFPHLPETFILREMNTLVRQGWDVALYPLIWQRRQPVLHTASREWIAGARRVPFISRAVIVEALRRALLDTPGFLALWGRTLWENRSSFNYLLRALSLLPRAALLARQMQQDGVEHIHAHYASHPALMAWLVHRLTGISYSVTVHAHDIFVRKAMLARKLRDAAFIAAISEYNRDYLARELGDWVRAKTHVVHCGVDPNRYAPREPGRWDTRRDAPGPPFEILSIGSLQPYKGQRVLLDACNRLRARGMDFRCRIIGEGELRSELEKQIAALDLGAHVELLGALPEEQVAAVLPTAHCYVQPSVVTANGKMEGIPVALMEAMAAGAPVVAANLSGVPELVHDDKTGYLVPPAAAAALADAIAAVQADPAAARRRAQAARAHVLREFELEGNVRQLAKLFEQVTEGQQPAVNLSDPRRRTKSHEGNLSEPSCDFVDQFSST